jgi:uroporphyrinogen-III synthase
MPGARPVVLSTRDEGGNAAFARVVAAWGADVLSLPLIRIGPPDDAQPLREAVAALDSFDWVVFTSAHAVDAACSLEQWRAAWAQPSRPRVGAVGHATARALLRHGITRVSVADGTARSLVAMLVGAGSAGTPARVLWPRSDRARTELPDGLRAAGATLVDPIAYRTESTAPNRVRQAIDALVAGRIDAAAFFSPSAVHACAEALPDGSFARAFDRVLVASIGPTTSAAIVDAGGRVDVEAAERTVRGLSRAIMTRLRAVEGART